MFGVPHPHRLLSRFPKPSPFQPPRSGPHDLAALLSQQDIPGVSALSLIISLTLPSPSSSPTVRQTPHIYACACRRDTNKRIRTGLWYMEGGNLTASYTNRRPGKPVALTLKRQLCQTAKNNEANGTIAIIFHIAGVQQQKKRQSYSSERGK